LSLHIHLDPVGGIAGDMFIAAMSDAFPELKEHLESLLSIDDFGQAAVSISFYRDKFLTGAAFRVRLAVPTGDKHTHHGHDEDHAHHEPDEHHAHRSYKEIRQTLEAAHLPAAVKEHALAIFRLIGEAEAEVHGTDLESVQFHEVGGWDSVVDVVGAAAIIEWLGPSTWSYSPLPVGGGYVKCAHGLLPVPVPATTLLLRGFEFRDDGVAGERVTPTGAAILKYLKPGRDLPGGSLCLTNTGCGFGTSEFAGFSNVLRACVYRTDNRKPTSEQVCLLCFEIDDMTAEELAACLERLRACDGVFDVMQLAATGKKGRLSTSVQIIASPAAGEEIAALVLNETTTLAVRYQTVSRFVVPRLIEEIKGEKSDIRVKVACRPDGRQTAKVEIDDIKSLSTSCFERRNLASEAEGQILKRKGKNDSRS
jgi:pyridinium-3,5-bisthiocarboxylic acid mononucleotide nickel chelatase